MRRYWFFVLIGIIVVTWCLCARSVSYWQGGFIEAEYRVTFRDDRGNPVRDVELVVLAADGQGSYCYPVSDYCPGKLPLSDEHGDLLFHHVACPVEFGGRCEHSWGGLVRSGYCTAPEYWCVFRLDGREVYRIAYKTLDSAATAVATPGASRHDPKQFVLRDWNGPVGRSIRAEGDTAERGGDVEVVERPVKFWIVTLPVTIPRSE
jgi:hypothetical protein